MCRNRNITWPLRALLPPGGRARRRYVWGSAGRGLDRGISRVGSMDCRLGRLGLPGPLPSPAPIDPASREDRAERPGYRPGLAFDSSLTKCLICSRVATRRSRNRIRSASVLTSTSSTTSSKRYWHGRKSVKLQLGSTSSILNITSRSCLATSSRAFALGLKDSAPAPSFSRVSGRGWGDRPCSRPGVQDVSKTVAASKPIARTLAATNLSLVEYMALSTRSINEATEAVRPFAAGLAARRTAA
jgi:hypothetical protein